MTKYAPDNQQGLRKLADKIGAHLDGELDTLAHTEAERSLQEHTLLRREAALQQAIREQLTAAPTEDAPPALRRRIETALKDTPTEPQPSSPLQGTINHVESIKSRIFPKGSLLPWLGWAVAATQAIVMVWWINTAPITPQGAPMVASALTDYRITVAHGLPATDSVDLSRIQSLMPFPVETLNLPDGELMGAWPTEIQGEPAAALAYRINNQIVVQYIVSEPLFFRQDVVRQAVADSGRYLTTDNHESLLAWPGTGSGNLLVGTLPESMLEKLPLNAIPRSSG